MRLIIRKECRVYTTPEIMERDYPELWDRVCEQEVQLRSLQGEIVKVMPEWKKRLVNSVEELAKSHEAQLDLQYYITLRALYLFAHKVWRNLYGLCDKLTNTPQGEDCDSEAYLNDLLSKLEDASLEDLLNTNDESLLICLAKIVEPITYDVVDVVGCWSLRDITRGNAYSPDLCHPDLLPSALSAEDFTEVNIGEIAAYNKMNRVY